MAIAELDSKGLRVAKKDPPLAVRGFNGAGDQPEPAPNSAVRPDTVVEVEMAADLPYPPHGR